MIETNDIQRALMSFDKRAERVANEILENTFVDTGPILNLISTHNNQVVYGRRGTGKTHLLKYLQQQIIKKGEVPIYVDLRNVGSNGAIYGDSTRSLAERAASLIVDVLSHLQNELYMVAVNALVSAPDPQQVSMRLDDFSDSLSTLKVSGDTLSTDTSEKENNGSAGLAVDLANDPKFSLSAEVTQHAKTTMSISRSGKEIVHLNFGRIGTALSGLVAVLGLSRLWLLIDEWSEVPVELQPYLADLLRRTILPEKSITLKIAAIDHRSNFAIFKNKGEYIGLELGADISADVNLDDFLVFDNKEGRATEFFKSLLYKHYASSEFANNEIDTPDKLIQHAFTQAPVFDEFVRAVEGVPRDALNLATKVATKAYGHQIAVAHVRAGARDWYQQDKHAVIREDPELSALLAMIIEEVIGTRRARAFLVESNIRIAEIERLFDARILHVLKKNVSSHDSPGTRYDVYKIDYGCYVDLINTAKNPGGLFTAETNSGSETYEQVPQDDYRSIRRAILKPEELIEKIRSSNQSH